VDSLPIPPAPVKRPPGRPLGSKSSTKARRARLARSAADALYQEVYAAVHACRLAGGQCNEVRLCMGASCRNLGMV
jgi:hypothetical protein